MRSVRFDMQARAGQGRGGDVLDEAGATPGHAAVTSGLEADHGSIRKALERLPVERFGGWETISKQAVETQVKRIKPLVRTFFLDRATGRFRGLVDVHTVQTYERSDGGARFSAARKLPAEVSGHFEGGEAVIEDAKLTRTRF